MAYFNSKVIETAPRPIPPTPPYVPPTPPTPPTPEEGSTPVINRPVFDGVYSFNVYNTNSENNRVDKILNNDTYLGELTLKKDTDIVNPIIYIESNNDLFLYNYAKIFNRYYYITNKVLTTGNLYMLELKLDVLMTYKESIRKIKCIIDKQQIKNNMYINDGSFVMQSNEANQIINFTNGFNDSGEFILITAGG